MLKTIKTNNIKVFAVVCNFLDPISAVLSFNRLGDSSLLLNIFLSLKKGFCFTSMYLEISKLFSLVFIEVKLDCFLSWISLRGLINSEDFSFLSRSSINVWNIIIKNLQKMQKNNQISTILKYEVLGNELATWNIEQVWNYCFQQHEW